MTTDAQGRRVREPLGHPGPTWSGTGELAADAAVPEASGGAERQLAVADRELAMFGRRATGYGIDMLVAGLVLGTLSALIDPNAGSQSFWEFDSADARNLALQIPWFWVWNSLGWSPGKRVVGVQIVMADGSAPGPWHGLVRTLVSLVSSFALAVGYLWAWWDPNHQTWHDRVAGTYVVRAAEKSEERPRAGR